jgi:transposase InsO family protein
VRPAARREAVAYLRQVFEMSERRACRVIGGDRTSVRYRNVRPDDGVLRERLKALAQERRRFGYRRLHVLLRREGHAVNRKRVQRLYREERLTVRQRGGRKRAIGTRRPMVTPLVAAYMPKSIGSSSRVSPALVTSPKKLGTKRARRKIMRLRNRLASPSFGEWARSAAQV